MGRFELGDLVRHKPTNRTGTIADEGLAPVGLYEYEPRYRIEK